MKLNKKAVELTLQTVVVGIILLIVMGVIVFIFAGGMNKNMAIFNNQADQVNQSIDDPSDKDGYINKLIDSSSIPALFIIGFKRKKSRYIHDY